MFTRLMPRRTTHALRVVAMVDGAWAKPPPGITTAPQSHLVQARTNATWRGIKDGGELVQGRSWFPSHRVAHVHLDSGRTRAEPGVWRFFFLWV
jgi:hypothetical protein